MLALEPAIEHLCTVRDFIRWGASRFQEAGLFYGHGTANALDEAAVLVLHALHLPFDLPEAYFDARLLPDERRQVVELLQQRVQKRLPAAYLTHEARFCGLPFYVDERVLVPRSPIAELIEQQFTPWLDPEGVRAVLDLCTGSGCIAIACAYAFPEAQVDAVELSPDALAVAQINVDKHQLAERLRLVAGDLYENLEYARYDLIVSNPPYVNRAEWQGLPAEYHAEPRMGLESGPDGLDCVRRILAQAGEHLNAGGILVVEVGSSAETLEAIYPEVPFTWLEFERGGDGVFLLTAQQVEEYADLFEKRCRSANA
ncbi:MAG: 50S ribosomal protein L3 N(5)-glutamine methyltransferase [Methylococcaceae bacterium]|nr:MAG: 50S ribosomal protein L3 N(5)-glutamine methyltransferase [Methylococcaceae bacterium]